jgi:hypothetical protein
MTAKNQCGSGSATLVTVPGQPGRVDNLEDARLLVLPLDVAGVPLGPVVQQLLQEVPQQATVCRR